MAKVTKKVLKGIVKECLVEILAEGLQGGLNESNTRKQMSLKRQHEERALNERRQKLETTIDSTVSSITDDTMMQSILADTARTTLQEQMGAERGQGGNSFGVSQPGIDINAIFSETSDQWASLAFGDKSTKS